MATTSAAQLEEEVLIQEGFLELLLQRKEAVRAKVSAAQETKTAKQQRLLELKQKQRHLIASRQRHAELRQELEQALEKSRERLLKMGGMEWLLLDNHDDEDEPTDDSIEHCNATTSPLNEAENNQSETPAHSTLLSSSIPSFATLPKLDDFWCCPKSTLPYLSTFIPGSRTRIETMMNVTALETLILDKRYPDGAHRRQSMFQSTLWLRGKDVAVEDNANDDGRMDADVTLCPYELAGECADSYCAFQHLSPRPKVSRERLRLPDMKLPPSFTIVEPARKRQRGQPKMMHASNQKSLVSPLVEEHWKEQDFISLPPPREDSDDYGDEDDSLAEVDSGEHSPEFWWLQESSKLRIEHHDLSSLSFLEWLHIVFEIKVSATSVETPEPCSDEFLVPFVGRMIDAIRISLHAGRFDVATGIGDVVNKYCQLSEAAKGLVGPLTLVMDLVASTWTYHAQPNGPFLAAFGANIGMAMVSEYLRLIHSRGEGENAALFGLIQQLFDPPGITKKLLKRDSNQYAALEGTTFPAEQDLRQILLCCIAYRKGHSTMNALLRSPPDETKNILQECARNPPKSRLSPTGGPTRLLARIITLAFSALGAALKFDRPLDPPEASILLKHMDYTARTLNSQSDDVMLQTILSPIYALQVCGLVRERKYRQAQLCLETHLKDDSLVSKFSEFLWCQYVQLRSTLPFSQEFVVSKQATIDLPHTIAIDHRTIATRIEELGIHCNHISLSGDTALLMQVCRKKKARASIEMWTEAFLSPDSMPQLLDLSGQVLGVTAGSEVPFETAVGLKPELYMPRSLLVGGWAISSLNLSNCQITELPLSFGKYFENLQVRNHAFVFYGPTFHDL
jgi:Putative zinc-finger domain